MRLESGVLWLFVVVVFATASLASGEQNKNEHGNKTSEQPTAATELSSNGLINGGGGGGPSKLTTTTTNNDAGDEEEELHLLDSDARSRNSPLVVNKQQFTDLFAYTFDDYIREATKQVQPPHHNQQQQHQLLDHDATQKTTRAGANIDQQQHLPGRLIVEDEDDDQAAAGQRVASISGDGQVAAAANKHGNSNNHNREVAAGRQQRLLLEEEEEEADATSSSGEQVKLLFGWKALPTNRCSRACGRGFRLNHLSCHDLKFKVRVEDELCLKHQLIKPNELSDEPCNQIDCEPKWTPIELDVVGAGPGGGGQLGGGGGVSSSKFKRVGCTMVNKLGQLIHLDEIYCQDASSNSTIADESQSAAPNSANNDNAPPPITNGRGEHQAREQNNDIFSLDDDELELTNNNNNNNNNNNHNNHNQPPPSQPQASNQHHHQPARHHHHHQSLNEPFFEPGAWSECQGGRCAGLGRRYRNVTCRLYLAKSGKFVSLPSSSCQSIGSASPDTEEPCYMDCASQVADNYDYSSPPVSDDDDEEQAKTAPRKSPSPSSSSNHDNDKRADNNNNRDQDDDDDEIYDPTVARYVWQHNSWTECSAKCLGGQMESLVDCFDKITGLRVSSQHCEQQLGLNAKPAPIIESCNDVPCAPEWRPGPFSNCSRTCGSTGLRSRSVACVQLISSDDESQQQSGAVEPAADYMLVPDDHCQRQPGLAMPHKQEPCNRVDCAPEWSLGPWSSCSPGESEQQQQQQQQQHPKKCPSGASTGLRNRTVVCLQEFAKLDVAQLASSQLSAATTSEQQVASKMSNDLLEALQVAAQNHWHPGKSIQVPLEQCYKLHGFVPPVSESCPLDEHNESSSLSCNQQKRQQDGDHYATRGSDETLPSSSFEFHIDADLKQNFRQMQGAGSRRRTVTLKVGGRAQLIEGRNVKIRCRVISPHTLVSDPREQQQQQQQGGNATTTATATSTSSSLATTKNLVNKQKANKWPVEWRKDGVKIFANNSTMAERVPNINHNKPTQFDQDQDQDENSILLANEVLINAQGPADSDRAQADEPQQLQQVAPSSTVAPTTTRSGRLMRKSRGRSLNIRSNQDQDTADETNDLAQPTASTSNADLAYQFVPQIGGRFSLIKDSTLRIKRLKLEDSGVYTCWAANSAISESIEINVVSRRHQATLRSWPSTY